MVETLPKPKRRRARAVSAPPRGHEHERKVAAWVRDPGDERAVSEGCYFDKSAALHKVDFFEKFLRIGPAEMRLLPWQRDDVVMPLFGWKRKDGSRRFRQGFIAIPKKNGKSFISSGIVLNMLLADGEPQSQVYGAAADREQAGIVYNEASQMTKNSPALNQRLVCVDSRKRIYSPLGGHFYHVLSADAFRSHGINSHLTIFDELHTQRFRTLYDSLIWAGAARRQPMFLSISTAGEDFANSLCGEVWQHAADVIEGRSLDTEFFARIWAAAKDDDWKDPATWYKANPSLGLTLQESEMRAAMIKAAENPRLLAAFLQLRLNIWPQGVVAAWLDLEAWDACAIPEAQRAAVLASLEGQPCLGGLDLSTKVDLSCFCLWFPQQRVLLAWHFCPADCMRQRMDTDRVPYPVWSAEGAITATPGNVIDFGAIKRCVLEAHARYKIVGLRFDPYQATATIQELQQAEVPCTEFRQGFISFNEPSKQFEADILSKGLRHFGNPCQRWQVGNAVVLTDDAGNIKPTKRRSREKIDFVAAAIMARAEPTKEEQEALASGGNAVVFL